MKIAILGCGSIGRRHLRNLQALGQTNLVAFDPVPQAREQVAAEMGINVYATTAELWQQNPDVALITAPSNLHIPLALEAVRSGCHIFVEKPLSHSLEQIDVL